jgi:hypothetical protein
MGTCMMFTVSADPKRRKMSVDPLQLMWTDPYTCMGFVENLSPEDQEVLLKASEPFSKAVKGAMDAILGKDKHVPVRVALLMAVNVATQANLLASLGFEIDEDGAPIYDPDEEGEDTESEE